MFTKIFVSALTVCLAISVSDVLAQVGSMDRPARDPLAALKSSQFDKAVKAAKPERPVQAITDIRASSVPKATSSRQKTLSKGRMNGAKYANDDDGGPRRGSGDPRIDMVARTGSDTDESGEIKGETLQKDNDTVKCLGCKLDEPATKPEKKQCDSACERAGLK